MSNDDACCFKNILKVIDVLQRNAEKCDSIDNSCSRKFLGNFTLADVFNTRPVTFYNKNGSLLEINYSLNDTVSTSSVFRVTKVEDCCCRVLILASNPDTTDPLRPYISTGREATINLECICALKCLPDVIVDNI